VEIRMRCGEGSEEENGSSVLRAINSKGSRGKAEIMDCRVRHVPFIKGQGERSAFARPW